jgi:hypothetical protein
VPPEQKAATSFVEDAMEQQRRLNELLPPTGIDLGKQENRQSGEASPGGDVT